MKKLIKKCPIIAASALSLVSICSCGNNRGTSNSNNDIVLYSDSDPFENDKIKIEVGTSTCYKNGENYYLSFGFSITNKELKTIEYQFKDATLERESTGATYTLSSSLIAVGKDGEKFSLDSELSKSKSYNSNIPSTIESDKYKFSLKINSYKVVYYLYETPDELRADRKVEYYISNKLVNTVTVKHKRKLTSYVYEGSDNLTYCEKWCLDSNRKTGVGSITITEDIKLYGASESNLKWSYDNSTLNGVNHVPSNGILLLPETTAGKQYSIGNYAIKDITVKKIYIPKTITKIYGGNFTGIGSAIICFEGTEQEWKDLFYLSSNIVTKNVVYNSKYTGK